MADSKKTGGSKKSVSQTREEAAEALRKAAELIASLNGDGNAESTASPKKTAAKKQAGNKSAVKNTSTKKPAASKPAAAKKSDKPTAAKPAAKKPTAKKPATKKTDGQNAEVAATSVQEPTPVIDMRETETAAAERQEVSETAVVPFPEKERAAETNNIANAESKTETDTPVSEAIAEDAKQAEEPIAAIAPVESDARSQAKKSDFKKVAKSAIDKGNIVAFIVANALLALSAVLLIISAFDITYYADGKSVTEWYGIFGYFKNASEIKARLDGVAFGWANGGYTVIGILMVLSVLAPVALIIKNTVLLIKNKDKRISAIDAAVSSAFITAYLGVINLFGANVTAGHVAALIVALALVAFALFSAALHGAGVFATAFAAGNVALATLCMFLLTASPVYDQAGWYAAASASGGGSAVVAFVLLAVTVAAFAAITVMRVKKLPAVLNIVIPATAGAAAIFALILFAVGKPDGFGLTAGFVCGAALTCVLAVIDVLFALVPPLKRMTDVSDNAASVGESVERAGESAIDTTSDSNADNSVGNKICPACGTENERDSTFCLKCGKRL